jgi:hypothetical protein
MKYSVEMVSGDIKHIPRVQKAFGWERMRMQTHSKINSNAVGSVVMGPCISSLGARWG